MLAMMSRARTSGVAISKIIFAAARKNEALSETPDSDKHRSMASSDPDPGFAPDANSRGPFTPTRWTLVLAARGHDSPKAQAALEDLCRIYWPPLYAYVRRRALGMKLFSRRHGRYAPISVAWVLSNELPRQCSYPLVEAGHRFSRSLLSLRALKLSVAE